MEGRVRGLWPLITRTLNNNNNNNNTATTNGHFVPCGVPGTCSISPDLYNILWGAAVTTPT